MEQGSDGNPEETAPGGDGNPEETAPGGGGTHHGNVNLGIGCSGRALVVWCRPAFRSKGSHCTIAWRTQGFTNHDVRHVLRIRRSFLNDGNVADITSTHNVQLRDGSNYMYFLHPDCGLARFVQKAREELPSEWTTEMLRIALHVTSRDAPPGSD